jgi:hypothetical protein
MSDLERRLGELHHQETEHQQYMRRLREGSLRNPEQFIDLMRAREIGMTTLYVSTLTPVPPAPAPDQRWFRRQQAIEPERPKW